MLDHIETLATLADTQFHRTQSSVSKRISALEREVGRKLVEAQGAVCANTRRPAPA
ncbi:MAG: DNA-binding transcriptional LysR family regulator [Candidatus Latescibacterota bacterium]|jgi:DNA-binding transcriptional LysR family regulator